MKSCYDIRTTKYLKEKGILNFVSLHQTLKRYLFCHLNVYTAASYNFSWLKIFIAMLIYWFWPLIIIKDKRQWCLSKWHCYLQVIATIGGAAYLLDKNGDFRNSFSDSWDRILSKHPIPFYYCVGNIFTYNCFHLSQKTQFGSV